MRLQFKYALLTYAQCGDLCGQLVCDHLGTLGAECIVARERHSDGGYHLHVFAEWERQFRSRRPDVFDVGGHHPNILPSRGTPEKGYDYAIKDGDVVAGGLARPSGNSLGPSGDKWAVIADSGSEEEFWRNVRRLDPKALCTNYPALRKYADSQFAADRDWYEVPPGLQYTSGVISDLAAWAEGSIGSSRGKCSLSDLVDSLAARQVFIWISNGHSGSRSARDLALIHSADRYIGRPRGLVLWGPTRTGKTSWARSLGRHVYTVGMVSGAELMHAPEAAYAVFDDMRGGIKMFPSFKEWFGAQEYVTIKRLYRDPQLVEWGKPCIWLGNSDPRHDMDPSDVSWFEGNCDFIEVDTPLF